MINLSGNFGAKAMSNPPNPQPMSAISGVRWGFAWSGSLLNEGGKKAGKWTLQSISAGSEGLEKVVGG